MYQRHLTAKLFLRHTHTAPIGYIASLGQGLVERVLQVESKHLVMLLGFSKLWSTHGKMRAVTLDEVVGVVKMGDIYRRDRPTHT